MKDIIKNDIKLVQEFNIKTNKLDNKYLSPKEAHQAILKGNLEGLR